LHAESADEPSLIAYSGKSAALLATSPGGLGGIRGLVFLRMLLGNLGVAVLPDQQAVPNGFQAFNDDGSMRDEKLEKRIRDLGGELVRFARKLSSN